MGTVNNTNHDLKLKTSLPYDNVENMLSNSCSKLYSMTLDGIEDTKSGPRKVIRISFEDPADRERFRANFQKTREATSSALPPTRMGIPKPHTPAG